MEGNLGAMLRAHELERHAMQAKLFLYEQLLIEHGIELPDDDGRRMYDASRRVVSLAGDLLAAFDELRRVYGSGVELLGGQPWRG